MSRSTRVRQQGVSGSCRTGKVRFSDRYSARVALVRAERDPSPRRGEFRFYRCPECAGWHLTSKEKVA